MSAQVESQVKALESQLRQGSARSEHQPNFGRLGALLTYCPPRQYTAPKPHESYTVQAVCSTRAFRIQEMLAVPGCHLLKHARLCHLQDNLYVPCNSLEEAVLCLLLCTESRSKVPALGIYIWMHLVLHTVQQLFATI